MDEAKLQRMDALQKKFQEFKSFERLTQEAVDNKWRDIMMSEKLQEQKSSIDNIRVNYVKQLDRLDSVIHRLLQWITDGEAQYQFALRAHKQNLDNLTALANKRLDTEEDRFNKALDSIVTKYEANKAKSLEEFNSHVAEVRDIKNAIEHEYAQKKEDLENKFRTEKDQLTMKSQEAISALRTHLLDETKKVLDRQQTESNLFKQKSNDKLQTFQQMYEKHRNNQITMKKNEATIIKLQSQISHWRRKIKNNERESRESNDRLRQEKDNLSHHFRDLKEVMAKFRQVEWRKRADVATAFEDAINLLQAKLSDAEKILKYAEITRKLETEREQVMPFPHSIVETDPEIQRQMAQFKLQMKGDSKYVAESDMFDKFYRRFNKVLLEKMALQREKEKLQKTNQRLKTMMKNYMEGMAVNETTMSKDNTLFIVNQRTNAPLRKVDQDGIPIIDAALTVGADKLQGY
ncbi:hypothetical protein TVAG_330860 [Trichomonas vaginalis G3]|uniref:Dynein regulatory complex subunit 2 n=1 Tax=Trichomonas vaginalis (strain ATCC PRA-98 / G3) TaxID=412133 RepID=A2GIM1_TRIV3|nr:regulation of cilium movement [Trichomonas vaginalis G3]EAX82996.1 hypothetical protein TVAG_330860 [Trichomonas vaginalis G3]KAI5487117.1 regulation of cilium movement [Trichomonas vaginalis G3]|eukprot:XP_001295926.1 hypothetical protein [Trichomonas vaginalis G3]